MLSMTISINICGNLIGRNNEKPGSEKRAVPLIYLMLGGNVMPIISTCQQCSIQFKVGPGARGIVCSVSCDRERKKIMVRDRAVIKYLKSPQYCQHCNTMIPYGKHGKNRKFCSSSCAAKFNNSGRIRSIESRKKTTESLYRFYKENPNHLSDKPKDDNGNRLRENQCAICDKIFLHPSPKRTCSKECCIINSRRKRIAYLKENAGTFNWIRKGKMNYVEQCFNDWLIEIGYRPNIDFVPLSNVVYNHETGTSYIMDFWLPTLNLNIELDGTHHLRPEQKLRDEIRDEYLRRVHDIKIIRIVVREWNNKKLRPLIKQSLIDGALGGSRTPMCPITVSPP
jgi:hypothetical protein